VYVRHHFCLSDHHTAAGSAIITGCDHACNCTKAPIAGAFSADAHCTFAQDVCAVDFPPPAGAVRRWGVGPVAHWTIGRKPKSLGPTDPRASTAPGVLRLGDPRPIKVCGSLPPSGRLLYRLDEQSIATPPTYAERLEFHLVATRLGSTRVGDTHEPAPGEHVLIVDSICVPLPRDSPGALLLLQPSSWLNLPRRLSPTRVSFHHQLKLRQRGGRQARLEVENQCEALGPAVIAPHGIRI